MKYPHTKVSCILPSFGFAVRCVSFLFLFLGLTGVTCASEKSQINNSMVKLYVTTHVPDYDLPWSTYMITSPEGSGVIIEGKRILTNAHVVANSRYIQVKKHRSAIRFEAQVEYVSHKADLAILKVEDESFFEGAIPVTIGDLPAIQESVLVCGFPAGGDLLSITKGVLSRIEYHKYVHSNLKLFAGQVDAAVNPGNSGGPVISNNEIIGIAMQINKGLENTAYMIPAPVINQFLKDVEDGLLNGPPSLGALTQTMENRAMRDKYKMQYGQSGVLVYKMIPPAKGLRKHDVLLAIEGKDIANDGTISVYDERVDFRYAVETKQVRESVKVKYLRKGMVFDEEIKLTSTIGSEFLVPQRIYDEKPKYFIYGGIVFCPLSYNIVTVYYDEDEWRNNFNPDVIQKISSLSDGSQEDVVIALKVLPDKVNSGYHGQEHLIITQVDGNPIQSFGQFVSYLNSLEKDFVTFQSSEGFQIVINHQEHLKSVERIIRKYDVR